MQPRRRRSHRAGHARIDRLVALAVRIPRRRGAGRAAAASRRGARKPRSDPSPKSSTQKSSSRPTTVAAVPSGRWMVDPARAACSSAVAPARARPPSTRSSSSSTLPPVALWPCSRAGITRVSLKTSRSPGAEQARQVEEPAIDSAPVRPSRCSSRLSLRRGGGVPRDQFVGKVVVEVAAQHRPRMLAEGPPGTGPLRAASGVRPGRPTPAAQAARRRRCGRHRGRRGHAHPRHCAAWTSRRPGAWPPASAACAGAARRA